MERAAARTGGSCWPGSRGRAAAGAGGIETAVLEGGEGPPIVLLHGPGEFAAKWLRVIPALVEGHRVIAPDLPAHGASGVPEGAP